MDTKGLTRPGPRRFAAALTAGLLLAAPLAQAQNFETYYGRPDWRDSGEDVKSVNQCPGGGSVTVATRRNGSSDQVLITRMDDNGVSDGAAPGTWQRAYLIAGAKFSSGLGIVELSERRGFAVTGSVRGSNGSSRIYVMNVDCAGNMVWTTVLENGDGNTLATGYDLIQSGALTSSANGDIVVVGDEILLGQGRTYGRIVRLGLGGNVIWDQRYDGREWPVLQFRAVTENLAATGAFTDLVVAGGASATSTRKALMLRTDANGAPVCATTLGDEREHRDFFGLTALLSRGYNGDSVLVGEARGPSEGALPRPYLARFGRGSCEPKAQADWYEPDKGGFSAFDVVEARDIDGNDGALAVAGTLYGTRGFSFAANPADLRQYAAGPLGRLYGDPVRKNEAIYAIDRKGDRFVLAGYTGIDRDGSGDPQDVYFVQSDPVLKTDCTEDWKPEGVGVDLPYKETRPDPKRIDKWSAASTEWIAASDWKYACERDPPNGCPGVIDNGTVRLGVHAAGYLNIECPAIGMSMGLNGTTLVGLRLMSTNGEASAPGAPCEGWGVANADSAAPITAYASRCGSSANVVAAPLTLPTSGPMDRATSSVTVGSTFRVVHRFTPSTTPFLYRVDVAIQNIGRTTVKDLRYTRGIDYDVPPMTFSEYITLAGSSPLLVGWNNNGFTSLDPLAVHPTTGAMTDNGPGDLGSHMDFRLGSLAPGATRTLVTYYGAAPTEKQALNALATVGAGLYSLGQPNYLNGSLWTAPIAGPDGPLLGIPNTFMYGLQTK
ncbi:hypothetical protein [Lysobacter enzymogenes]|uniref:hypothetical protein n=1 Tax=Lysobacter enzymogenes TaxID=69 RepID=UPI001A96C8DF|nr:hypothetical protein [Lysobacter enzymogenes]QQP96636.1 hypothetical protein JHW38_00835 [Lysobacter enzymogenes]